jgi:hypothetical protein
MSDQVKSIQITGGAEIMGSKRRRSRKGQKGGEGLQVHKGEQQKGGASGYQNPMQLSGSAPIGEAYKPLVPAAQILAPVPVAGSAPPMVLANLDGGGKKVELRKAPQQKKVQLHSKKIGTALPLKMKKKTRKIVLGLVALEKRQTRAKKISQRMKEIPIDQLRKELVEQGLIKATSKAPESILRQIAADAQIVGGNGL